MDTRPFSGNNAVENAGTIWRNINVPGRWEMLIVVTYDVSTESSEGRARLRKVARQCKNYGQRVQNSVFECKMDEAQFVAFRGSLIKLIDEKEDSLRFYRLGNNYQNRIEHYGSKEVQDIDSPLIF